MATEEKADPLIMIALEDFDPGHSELMNETIGDAFEFLGQMGYIIHGKATR